MDGAESSTTEILDRIDRDAASTIERLTQAREQIAQLKGSPGSAVTLGSALHPVANHPLSEQNQVLLAVYGQLEGEEAVSGYLDAVTETRDDPVLREFENLPEDADEDTCILLAGLCNSAQVDVIVRASALHDSWVTREARRAFTERPERLSSGTSVLARKMRRRYDDSLPGRWRT